MCQKCLKMTSLQYNQICLVQLVKPNSKTENSQIGMRIDFNGIKLIHKKFEEKERFKTATHCSSKYLE